MASAPLIPALSEMEFDRFPSLPRLWMPRTGLINPTRLVRPRMKPAIEAGLMLFVEAATLFMRPVL